MLRDMILDFFRDQWNTNHNDVINIEEFGKLFGDDESIRKQLRSFHAAGYIYLAFGANGLDMLVLTKTLVEQFKSDS